MNGRLGINQPKKIDYKHYIRLLRDKKYWILSIVILFSLAWIKVMPEYLIAQKKYQFTAVIRFDDPRIQARSGTIDQQLTLMETESRTRLIKTTRFLTRVIDSLKLNVLSQTPGLSRKEIFAEIELDENPKYGTYTIKKIKDGKLQLLYTDKTENKENYVLQTIDYGTDSVITFAANNLKLGVFTNIFQKWDEIKFKCVPTHNLVFSLRNKIKTNLNRQQTIFTINMDYKDPYLGRDILNAIAKLFLKESLESKRFRTRNLLISLKEQLNKSKSELEQADNALRRFRERNPHIYLTSDLVAVNQRVASEEVQRNQIRKNLARLNQLTNELEKAKNAYDRDLIYQEILSFLQEQRIPGITALQQQYQNVLTQKEALFEQNYADNHPKMVEVNNALNGLQMKVDERVKEFINEQTNHLNDLNKTIQEAEKRLLQSPQKEIELARLQRNREAKAQIYSDLLVRYSQAKVADVSITPDAELIQEAEIPVMTDTLNDLLIKWLIISLGPLLGVVLTVGLFIGMDVIKHRARSEKDIELQIELPVLASIPSVGKNKESFKDFEHGRRMDPKLVTIDFTPSPASIAFRDLRTKLTLGGENSQYHLLFTSLAAGEGKSLVAANMAITFAQLKKPTLLIDADLWRGVQHNSFVCNKKPGLSDILAKNELFTIEMLGQAIQKTTIPNLHLMSRGNEVPNPTELLMDNRMGELFAFLTKRFHYILFDTPPIGLIPDALVLNNFIKNVVLVTRYGQTDLKKLKKQVSQYESFKENIVGVVLNGIKQIKKDNYYYSYYKY